MPPRKPIQKIYETGQSMLEFALTLPIVLALIFGIIEFSRFMFFYSTVATASREAARFGATVEGDLYGSPRYIDCEGIKSEAVRVGRLVGVTAADVEIFYDQGPSDSGPYPACPVDPDYIILGDRVVVRVNATFKPLGVIVNIPSFPVLTTSKRTIVMNVPIGPVSTSVRVTGTVKFIPTFTPTTAPTSTKTLLPSPTSTGPTPTPTNTSTVTPTPTITPTFVTPDAPLFGGFSYTSTGRKCTNIVIGWYPNPTWADNPGSGASSYQLYIGATLSGYIGPDDPNATVWQTDYDLNDNQTESFSIMALFPGPIASQLMVRTFTCLAGVLVDTTK